jgi:hypothetical protein
VGNRLTDWHMIIASVAFINLNEGLDPFVWSLHKDGVFTVKSMYSYLVNNGVKVTQVIWHLKLPLNIKLFMLYFKREVIFTKDNLATRNWNGSKLCNFCSKSETIRHLFFEYHLLEFIWIFP